MFRRTAYPFLPISPASGYLGTSAIWVASGSRLIRALDCAVRKLMGLILGVGGRMLFGTERKETHACCFWVVLRQEPDGRSLNWILTGEERG